MIDKGLTYAYAEGGPVASEGRPRPNPFVRPMPNGIVYDNITVGGPAVLPPAVARDLFMTTLPWADRLFCPPQRRPFLECLGIFFHNSLYLTGSP
jgi:hypothetical protein